MNIQNSRHFSYAELTIPKPTDNNNKHGEQIICLSFVL